MRYVFSLVIFLLLGSLILPFASADGSIHVYDRDRWDLATEKQQFCAINYKDGIQHMILTVDPGDELKGEKAVWIFPVPASPDKTVIDIMKGFPLLAGYDVEERAADSVYLAFSFMQATQIYTAPILLRMAVTGIGSTKDAAAGVDVYETIEKMGLTTELVSAQDGSSFADYIASKGLELTESSKSIFNEYSGKDYSFVISWISDIKKFNQERNETEPRHRYQASKNAIGVYISFPTERIYYPLKPTSVYGSERVPAVIYVMDYVEQELYPEIKEDTEIRYFFQNRVYSPQELSNFFAGYEKGPVKSERVASNITQQYSIVQDVKYTKIKLNPPSKYLTEDLWIDVSTPLKVKAADIANRFYWYYGLTIFILLSCLASLISGMIVFRGRKISKLKFALFGLCNLLTLIGFTIAAYITKIDIRFVQAKEVPKPSVRFGRTKFIILFTAIFLALTIICQLIIKIIF